jgi:hypothetical protein
MPVLIPFPAKKIRMSNLFPGCAGFITVITGQPEQTVWKT